MGDLSINPSEVLRINGATKDCIAGETILAGQVLYLASGRTVGLAAASDDIAQANILGWALNSASTGQPVEVLTTGRLTLGATANPEVGQTYILSATPGAVCPVTDLVDGMMLTVLGIGGEDTTIALALIQSKLTKQAAQDFGDYRMSMAVPLYTTPPSSVWNAYTAVGLPKLAFVSVTFDASHDGAGGTGPGGEVNPAFTTAINALRAKGVKVYGYVRTLYTRRPIEEVLADITTMYEFYPMLDGIFGDEIANHQFKYYKQMWDLIQTKSGRDFALNPGGDVVESYMLISTTICIFEDTFAAWQTYTPMAYMANYDRRRFWALVHDCGSSDDATEAFDLARERNVGNFYVTDQTEPYPWTPLSAYHDLMLTKLEETAAAFSPVDIPGRRLQFSAEHVTKDGSNIVSAVLDQAARKLDLTPTGTGPTWVANHLNGLPVLRFAGANPVQNTSVGTINQGYTIAVVAKSTVDDKVIVGGHEVGIYESSGNAAYQASLFRRGTVAINGVWSIIVATFDHDRGVWQLRVNGAVASIDDPGNYNMINFCLGSYVSDDGTHDMTGDIEEAIVYDRTLSQPEIDDLEAYLAARTALTLAA